MTRSLLLRGMFTGLLAGLLFFVAAHWLGEPQVDRSIAFESASALAHGEAPEPEIYTRHTQKTFGLLTAALAYGASIGGIFGLVFAYCHGRIGPTRPRALAAALAAFGFLTLVFVPTLKYPANPPAVGNPETIGIRTAAFFLMILISILAMVASIRIARSLTRRFGLWNATLLAAAVFAILIAACAHFLPTINEVPPTFPADVLWRFRLASWGLQAILWAALGLLFGWLTERDPHWSLPASAATHATL